MSEHEQGLDAGHLADGVVDRAQALDPEHVAGDADDEQVVAVLAEDRLGRDAGVGAAEHSANGSCATEAPSTIATPKVIGSSGSTTGSRVSPWNIPRTWSTTR